MKRKYSWLNHFFNFLAVILGVYLAFYINEQAKSNQDKRERIWLMNSLATDLAGDIKTYEKYQIPENVRHQENIAGLLQALSTGEVAGIEEKLSAVFQVENYAPTASTYSSMKAAGKIGLIEDLLLQKELTDFYEGLVVESIRKGEFQADFFTDELLRWMTENTDLTTMEIRNEAALVVLRNKLIIYESLISQKVGSYEMIVAESRLLKGHLDSLLRVE